VLVRNGEFKEAELVDALNAPGKVDIPGASGKRNLHDNLSDLRAQVAANQKVVLFRLFPEVEDKQLKKR
jgi:5-oxoprolinase (ATP-hydrolysing)